jgi:hypothetical protein
MAALIEITARLATRGERGGAERASRAALALLREHLDQIHTSADEGPKDAKLFRPVVPAMRAAISSSISRLGDARTAIETDVLAQLIEGILDVARPSDAATVQVCSALNRIEDLISVQVAGRILVSAGLRALETDDDNAMAEVWRGFARRVRSPGGTAIESVALDAAHVAAAAMWLNYQSAARAWRRVWELIPYPDLPSQVVRFRAAVEIGASALVAGVISVAVDVALQLKAENVDFDVLGAYLTQPGMLARIKAMSDLSSGYLGESPKDAVVNFIDFGRRVALAVL